MVSPRPPSKKAVKENQTTKARQLVLGDGKTAMAGFPDGLVHKITGLSAPFKQTF